MLPNGESRPVTGALYGTIFVPPPLEVLLVPSTSRPSNWRTDLMKDLHSFLPPLLPFSFISPFIASSPGSMDDITSTLWTGRRTYVVVIERGAEHHRDYSCAYAYSSADCFWVDFKGPWKSARCPSQERESQKRKSFFFQVVRKVLLRVMPGPSFSYFPFPFLRGGFCAKNNKKEEREGRNEFWIDTTTRVCFRGDQRGERRRKAM